MIAANLQKIQKSLRSTTQLVVVTKKRSLTDIKKVLDLGHMKFGENRVQDLLEKRELLPDNIEWHFIGHLQKNKIKYIAPFIALIHAVDNEKLLREINKQAVKNKRTIPVLLQVHIAQEEAKYGMNPSELFDLCEKVKMDEYPNVIVKGLMGMATNTSDTEQIKNEFNSLKELFDKVNTEYFTVDTLSMGMTNDYLMAEKCGGNMVRIGSGVFV